MDAQLRKEADIRRRISESLAIIHQGLRTVGSLLAVQNDVIAVFVPRILSALLGVVVAAPAVLYADEAFQTFQVSRNKRLILRIGLTAPNRSTSSS